jgi:hypothetical protein
LFLPKRLSLLVNTAKQFLEGVDEFLYTLLLQLSRDPLVEDPDLCKAWPTKQPFELLVGQAGMAMAALPSRSLS